MPNWDVRLTAPGIFAVLGKNVWGVMVEAADAEGAIAAALAQVPVPGDWDVVSVVSGEDR